MKDLLSANGAVFTERDGWLLPTHFGSVAGEYRAARSAVALMDLSHRGLLQLTGPDRLSFLQGMLSNDLRSLQPFRGQYAALLTQQGKVIADVRVLCALNSFYLDFWEHLKERILEHLDRYLVADEVEIADRSDEYATVSLQGPRAEALLHSLGTVAELPANPQQHVMANIEETATCVVRQTHTGEIGFDLIAANASLRRIAEKLSAAGKPFSSAWIGEEAQNILRVEAGIPRYGIDFSEDNLLLEAGLDNAVSFTKGCYLGQEVVERIRSRGHVNRKLVGLLLEGRAPAQSGTAVLAGDQEVGKVTSSVASPALGRPIALGYVHRDFWAAGTRLLVKHDGPAVPATVTALPFVEHRMETAASS